MSQCQMQILLFDRKTAQTQVLLLINVIYSYKVLLIKTPWQMASGSSFEPSKSFYIFHGILRLKGQRSIHSITQPILMRSSFKKVWELVNPNNLLRSCNFANKVVTLLTPWHLYWYLLHLLKLLVRLNLYFIVTNKYSQDWKQFSKLQYCRDDVLLGITFFI